MTHEANVRILLVEDNLETCRLFQKILEKRGFHVDLAFDGQEAYEKASEGGYDLILLDVMLPVMSGLEVLQGLSDKPPVGKNGPIVMLTNVGHEEVVRKAMSLGAMSYMDKSNLEPDQLVERVEEVLGRTKAKD